ncbi:MAG: hypothetical protein KC652_12420 [Cyanobacteria bacterium HKST-UBA01]|nr:hypothetical protein [Cyanobacteria bacterium HKST-UBA01]
MDKFREGPRVETRLTPKDYIQFVKEAERRGLSKSQLARDAICSHLDRLRVGESDEKDSKLILEVRKSTERLASLLARIAIDVGTILNLMYSRMGKETRDQDISMAEGRAIKRMRRKLEGEENKLKEALKKEMGSKG